MLLKLPSSMFVPLLAPLGRREDGRRGRFFRGREWRGGLAGLALGRGHRHGRHLLLRGRALDDRGPEPMRGHHREAERGQHEYRASDRRQLGEEAPCTAATEHGLRAAAAERGAYVCALALL